jgi:uracil-DNA glycosylase
MRSTEVPELNLFAEDKEHEMEDLKRRAAGIVPSACEPGRPMVWGYGSLETPLVIVAEAPGEYEEKHGRPFMGPAGTVLDRELARVGLPREGIYITNVVKCRPTQKTGARISNRAPLVAEARAWLPFLLEELGIISPSTIICMGATSARWVVKKDFALTRERGQWLPGPAGTMAIATFHPAYILRLEGPPRDGAIVALRADLEKVRARLEQRNEMRRIAA